MLELSGLSKTVNGQSVLAGVSASIAPGTPTAIVGLSRTGREAIVRLLRGDDKPNTGAIRLGGADIARARREKGRILRVGPVVPGASGQRVGKLLDAAMAARAGLSAALDARVSDLAPDQRMRLGVAQAVAEQPGLLILDAPASQLPRATRDAFAASLKELLAVHSGVTLVIAASSEEALGPDGDILVVEAGRVIQQGSARDVSGHPVNLTSAAATSWPMLNTLPMTARDGRGILADGSRLQMPEGRQLPEAGACTLAFHPEDVTLERASPGCVRFVVRAGAEEARGEHRFLNVTFAGAPWVCPLATPAPPSGALLNAFIDQSRLMVFDATGRSLD